MSVSLYVSLWPDWWLRCDVILCPVKSRLYLFIWNQHPQFSNLTKSISFSIQYINNTLFIVGKNMDQCTQNLYFDNFFPEFFTKLINYMNYILCRYFGFKWIKYFRSKQICVFKIFICASGVHMNHYQTPGICNTYKTCLCTKRKINNLLCKNMYTYTQNTSHSVQVSYSIRHSLKTDTIQNIKMIFLFWYQILIFQNTNLGSFTRVCYTWAPIYSEFYVL